MTKVTVVLYDTVMRRADVEVDVPDELELEEMYGFIGKMLDEDTLEIDWEVEEVMSVPEIMDIKE